MENNIKKQSKIVKLWKYFTAYEKIWLFSLCTIGIILAILFPGEQGWLRIFEIITLIGGCSCELLVSKQSKWCFIVSLFFYDLTTTVVYFFNGYYISALFEVLFWMPILILSFFTWDKKQDAENSQLVEVKAITKAKRDLIIFFSVLCISVATGLLFTAIESIASGMSPYWYLDALANTFSVCNGLFLWLRYKEQWIPWYGVCIIEAIMWILAGNYIMLVLSVGYLTNTTYGYIKWSKYIKEHSNKKSVNKKETSNKQENIEIKEQVNV